MGVFRCSTAKCPSRRDQVPAGRETGTVKAACENVVVQIPDRCPASARIVKQIIWVEVAIEIGGPDKLPAAGEGWAIEAADKRGPGEIPDRCLARAGVEE
jgi:hypothetical protein